MSVKAGHDLKRAGIETAISRGALRTEEGPAEHSSTCTCGTSNRATKAPTSDCARLRLDCARCIRMRASATAPVRPVL
jgi:hypothetical protein